MENIGIIAVIVIFVGLAILGIFSNGHPTGEGEFSHEEMENLMSTPDEYE